MDEIVPYLRPALPARVFRSYIYDPQLQPPLDHLSSRESCLQLPSSISIMLRLSPGLVLGELVSPSHQTWYSKLIDCFRSCWMGVPGGGERCEQMVKTALKIGYRHLDTVSASTTHQRNTSTDRMMQASGYGNEEHVGKAVKESGIPRSEIYITTKLGYVLRGHWGYDRI